MLDPLKQRDNGYNFLAIILSDIGRFPKSMAIEEIKSVWFSLGLNFCYHYVTGGFSQSVI